MSEKGNVLSVCVCMCVYIEIMHIYYFAKSKYLHTAKS